jgi:hypothetical protein
MIDMRYEFRIMLWHIFYIFLFAVLSLFFWGAGHGSAVPFVVFFAPFVIDFFTKNWTDLHVIAALFQMPVYCFILWIFHKRKLDQRYLFILPTIHFLSAVNAIFFSGLNLSDRYYYWFFASILIMFFYWKKYFSLLQAK